MPVCVTLQDTAVPVEWDRGLVPALLGRSGTLCQAVASLARCTKG